MITLLLSPDQVEVAASLLKEEEIVAFPTETVYGLGARIYSEDALKKIFAAKNRPADNPLIIHVASLQQIEEIAEEIPQIFYRLAEAFFPGPLTVILKKRRHLSSILSAGLETIAIRMPSHPIAKALIEMVGEPIAAPSANLSGRPSATSHLHVLEDFEGRIAAVINGGSSDLGIESTVVNLVSEGPLLMRPGSITREEIERVLEMPVELCLHIKNGKTPSPGMKYRHYAPKAPIHLYTSEKDIQEHLASAPAKKRMLLARNRVDETKNLPFFPLTAKALYETLRLSDREGYQEILVYCDKEIQSSAGLMNRLHHATLQDK
ncbi:MAG: threonylcarbamoyl-AMP synthase [Chlamydiales bacterium]|nr:threonylcarbamoyl-AMP synthase [Chlamydiales bacterium]